MKVRYYILKREYSGKYKWGMINVREATTIEFALFYFQSNFSIKVLVWNILLNSFLIVSSWISWVSINMLSVMKWLLMRNHSFNDERRLDIINNTVGNIIEKWWMSEEQLSLN